jgi:uncharacterized protein (TIGR02284 family)
MATSNNEAISVLNDLIETCEDGINGFRTASEAVQSPEAKTVFQSRIAQILDAQSQLRNAVRELGGKPAGHGHAAAPLHRGWINLKAAITGKSDEAIIAEVVRGEEVAVEWYHDALKKPLPPDIALMVRALARGAEQTLERIRQLRSAGPRTRPASAETQPRANHRAG